MKAEDKIPVLENIVDSCPLELVKEFDEIIVEIMEKYREFRKNDPEEYLQYSRGWHYLIFQYIEKYRTGAYALDIGALFGVTSVFLSRIGMNVTALDGYADEIPDEIKSKYDLSFIFANLEHTNRIPLFNDFFDMVIMSEVLEHLNYSPIPVLLTLRNAMKADGVLIINTPDDREYPDVPEGPVARNCHHLDIPIWEKDAPRQAFPHSKQYLYKEFVELLENCGFKIREFIKFRYEGLHMLAIAGIDPHWTPGDRVKQIMNSQFPDYEVPSARSQKFNWALPLSGRRR